VDPNVLYTIAVSNLYKTTNGAGKWSLLFDPDESLSSCIRVAPSDNQTIYVSGSSALFRTTDGGASWTDIVSGLSGGSITSIGVHPNEPLTVYVCKSGWTDGSHVFKSTDGGDNWTNVTNDLPNVPCNSVVIDPDHPDHVYVGTDLGVYLSSDASASWEEWNTNLPNVVVDELDIQNRYYIPVSALKGDNIVDRGDNISWYSGQTLFNLLDNIDIAGFSKEESFRFPVQYVNRPNLDFRGFCGTVASGSVKVADDITILPSGKTTKIKQIIDAGTTSEINRAFSPMAITITTEDEVDISRGDMIVCTKDIPRVSNSLKVMMVWMDEEPMVLDKIYDIKIASAVVLASFEHINYKIDVNTYKREQVEKLELNDIASCKLILTRPIAADKYKQNRQTGSFIIIDRVTNNTVGAGMIVDVAKREDKKINLFDIWNTKKQLLDKKDNIIKFRERDVLFISVGKNIGFEQNGKGEEFLRPVVVLKKFSSYSFIGTPLTSKNKEGIFYHKVRFYKNRKSSYTFSNKNV
jgi:molybdopterin-guanine dinucleotide biosynthesis protein